MKHSWLWWKSDDVRVESQQAEEEGRDLTGVRKGLDALMADGADTGDDFQQKTDELLDRIQNLPIRPDNPYVEPSTLEEIRLERPDGPRELDLAGGDNVLSDRIHGAWLGRCAGCLLGKPVEGAKSYLIRHIVESAGADMITDYLWRMGPTQKACEEAGLGNLLEFGKGVSHMVVDDDINYTMIGMSIIKEKGIGFVPEDMADLWMIKMPLLVTCTAERAAYRNFTNRIFPPMSAAFRNPYREWIGSQIRADFFGYVALGRPELAAELAWRDASISHVKNGIYGEMWAAAMLAAAAVESDPARIIKIGLSEVPAKSRFAESIQNVLAWYGDGISYEDAVRRLTAKWDENNQHHWCHTISNAMLVSIALLWGGGDLEKAVTYSVWPGFDTDCNGATVGSVMGMVLGAKVLPDKWIGLMNDTVHTAVAGYNVSTISGTAGEMFELFQKYRR